MQLLEEVTFNTDESVELVVRELRVSKLNQLCVYKLSNAIKSWGWRDFFPYFGPFSVTPYQSVSKSSH